MINDISEILTSSEALSRLAAENSLSILTMLSELLNELE